MHPSIIDTGRAKDHSLMDHSLLSEHDLVARLQRGEQRAGEELYRRYRDSVERYCYQLMHDREIARDATNDTFEVVLGNIADLRDAVSFKAWMFRIARNNCFMVARRLSHQLTLEDTEEVWEERTPLTESLEGELRRLVHEAIARLKPIYREAIVLREFESLSYREIAEATQSSISSVKFRIHKARLALADSLGRYLDEREGP
jgi:RNA polymerase sigma-70 factor (ECF subfamily)